MKRIVKLVALIAVLLVPALALAGQVIFKTFSVTPTISTTAYSANDVVGSLATIDRVCESRMTAEVRGFVIADKAAVGADTDLVIFSSNPSGSTFTDNAAFDPTDTDLAKIAAVIPATTHKAFADNGATQAKNITYSVKCEKVSPYNGRLYTVLVTRGTPTYASTSDVTYTIDVIAD